MGKYNDDRDHEFFLCECCSSEHHFLMHFDREKHEAYLEVYLINNDSFWIRLIRAFKYLFCLPSYPYGHYDTVLLGKEDLEHLFNCTKRTL